LHACESGDRGCTSRRALKLARLEGCSTNVGGLLAAAFASPGSHLSHTEDCVPAPEVINEALIECLPLAWNIGVEERITAAYGSDVTNEVNGLYEYAVRRPVDWTRETHDQATARVATERRCLPFPHGEGHRKAVKVFLVRLALLGSLSQFLHTGSSTPTWPPRSRGGGCRARAPDRPTRAWLRRMLGGTHHSPARS
jgi:hypothetical protein